MNQKIFLAMILLAACLGLGLMALIAAIKGFRRGEFHHRSKWFYRAQDKVFFHIVNTTIGLGGLSLIIFAIVFAIRILSNLEDWR